VKPVLHTVQVPATSQVVQALSVQAAQTLAPLFHLPTPQLIKVSQFPAAFLN
jgi:hypothetical protein